MADLDVTMADRFGWDGGTGARQVGTADEGEAGGVAAALLSEMAQGDEHPRRPCRVRVLRRAHHAEDPTHRCPLPPSKSRATPVVSLIPTESR